VSFLRQRHEGLVHRDEDSPCTPNAAEARNTKARTTRPAELYAAAMGAHVLSQILPEQLVPGMLDFYNNYKKAVVGSGVPGADEALVASVMGAIADRCFPNSIWSHSRYRNGVRQ